MDRDSSRAAELTAEQFQWLSNEGWSTGPIDPGLQRLADLGLIEIQVKQHRIKGRQVYSWGPTETGAALGPYPQRYGKPEIEGLS